jgi:hypothetical protein
VPDHPQFHNLFEVAGLFLKLGTISFGGPAAHIPEGRAHGPTLGNGCARWISGIDFTVHEGEVLLASWDPTAQARRPPSAC